MGQPERLPPTSEALRDDATRPYFLWWTEATVGDLRKYLESEDPEERAYWMGAMLREANTRDVWLFVTADEIRALWPRLIRYLGRSREMWAWLLGLPKPVWPPHNAYHAPLPQPPTAYGIAQDVSGPPSCFREGGLEPPWEETMDIEKILVQFDAILNKVKVKSEALRFNHDDQQHVYVICLHGTILEIAEGSLSLLKRRDRTCVPILLRSMLEAYVDLSNLARDPGYTDNMRAEWLRQSVRVLKNARKNNRNPYLENLAGDHGPSSKILMFDQELKELKSKGRSPLRVYERFERAGEEDRYRSVYSHLCTHAHNNINSLRARHLEDGRVRYFQPINENEVCAYIDTMAGIVANSLGFTCELCEGESLDPEIKMAVESLRETFRKD